jgi:hypothetical protein
MAEVYSHSHARKTLQNFAGQLARNQYVWNALQLAITPQVYWSPPPPLQETAQMAPKIHVTSALAHAALHI